MVCLAALIAVAQSPQASKPPELHTGDVVFQSSKSSRSALIRRASESPYSHVGLVEVASDGTFVIEAVEPVSRTPWAVWYARGSGQKITVTRAKHASPQQLQQVVSTARSWLGVHYDARYQWSDERLYCSELVRKAFSAIAIEAGVMQPISSLALTPGERADGLKRGIDPAEVVVTAASIAADDDFETVYSSF